LSAPGHGVRHVIISLPEVARIFAISLPTCPDLGPNLAPINRIINTPARGFTMMEGYGKRVLVVEDDDDVRTLISVILRETRYNVYEACDGLEAIDALKKRRYDVLLTDYHMPKMDGLELLDLTRAMWPELPVILATSDLLLTEQTPNSLLEPAYAILEKPFVRAELLTLIRSAIDGLPRPALHAGRPHAAYQALA
jgi:CheY-like chemotaxis protein